MLLRYFSMSTPSTLQQLGQFASRHYLFDVPAAYKLHKYIFLPVTNNKQ
jgi:hypothetical protein